MTDLVQFVRNEIEETLLRNCTFACLPLEKLSEIADHIEKLEAEVGRLVKSRNKWGKLYNQTLEKLRLSVMSDSEYVKIIDEKCAEQADRIEKLEAALRVYADEDHWFGDKFEPIMFPEGECKCCYEHFSDQGEIARKALEGKDD